MWNFVDLFYRNQGQENAGYVTDPFLSRLATAAGLPARLIIDGSKSIALQSPVREADAQAQAAGLASTPSFLIGPEGGHGTEARDRRAEPRRVHHGDRRWLDR